MRFEFWATAAILATFSTAAAAQAPAGNAPSVSNVIACRAEANPEARLRCYDSAVAALSNAVAKGDVVAVGREEIRRTRRELFGFSLPRIGLFSGDNDSPEAKELNAKIRSVASAGYGKWLITLDSGARWQTTDPLLRQDDPRPGQDVRIRRGTLGSYMLAINGQRSVRAKRVQ